MHEHTHTHTHAHIHKHTHAHANTRVHTQTHVKTNTYMYMVYIYIYVYGIYIPIHICIWYIYTYISFGPLRTKGEIFRSVANKRGDFFEGKKKVPPRKVLPKNEGTTEGGKMRGLMRRKKNRETAFSTF